MSIRRTPNGTWRVQYREGGKQRSRNFRTKAEAEIFDAEVKKKHIMGQPIVRLQDAPKLEDFAISWLAERQDLAAGSVELYADSLQNHVIPHLGDRRVHASELRPADIDKWHRERRASGVGPSALHLARGVLSQVLDTAVLPHELLESNPVKAVKPFPVKRAPANFLLSSDVERLRKFLLDRGEIQSATLIGVLAYAGIRPQDALALEWTHLGKKLSVVQKNVRGEILPGSKTGMSYRREIYLAEPLREDLLAWRRELRNPADGYIFVRPGTSTVWSDSDYMRWRSTIQRRARDGEVPLKKPYDLRHTCASLLASAGWNHLEIAQQLGHKPATSVSVYQHLIMREDEKRISIDDQIRKARDDASKRGNRA